MNLSILVPLLACITCCMLTVAILARGSANLSNRLGAALTSSAAFWALCEMLWSASYEADTALFLVRLAAWGWIPIGPITLHLFLCITGHPARQRPHLIVGLYAVSIALGVMAVATPWLDAAAVPTPWGWGYRVGPAFPVAYLFAAGTFAAGLALGIRSFRSALAPGERRQAYVLLGGMLLCLTIATATDGLLPALGYQAPRLGVAAITLFAGTVAWGFQRYGYSVLAPGVFASEILATLPDGVALLRLDGRIRFVNRGMKRLAQLPARALEERCIDTLLEEVRIDPREELVDRECVLIAAAGERVPVAVSTSLLRDKRQNPAGLVLVARDLRWRTCATVSRCPIAWRPWVGSRRASPTRSTTPSRSFAPTSGPWRVSSSPWARSCRRSSTRRSPHPSRRAGR
jgi:PAS domain-containing protein